MNNLGLLMKINILNTIKYNELKNGDKKEKNTPEQPERIVPQEKMLYHTNDLKYEFPANSYTILIYQK